eukprot:TRINITY_DN108_c1_g2_i1.p2 TRINITY_DN108_c1_g2~~TRINITY_DN108_c1_g2_i1.p2  ORF type:complete len:315 (+),score=117.06 TRINITY_DN108_c1_g2_i1:101-1045(+)
MGLSYEDLVEIPEKVLTWLRDTLKEAVKAIIKALGLCACITNISLLRSGSKVMKELSGLDAGFAKLKGEAKAADAGLSDVSKIEFSVEVLKEVVSTVGDVMGAVTEFLALAAKKAAKDTVEEAEELVEVMKSFMAFLDGGFAFALPKFEVDDLKDFFSNITNIIPEAMKNAGFKLFKFLMKMADDTVKAFATSCTTMLAILMPETAVEEGAFEVMVAGVEGSDDICLLSMLGLIRIGNKLEEKEKEVLDLFDKVAENDGNSAAKKAAAVVSKTVLQTLEFVEDGMDAMDDALSDAGSAIEDVAEGARDFMKKIF